MNIVRRALQSLFSSSAFCVIGVIAYVGTASAVTLNNANATVEIDPTSDAGVYTWEIGGPGAKDYLVKQWWWYRIGNAGPQSSIDTISAPVVNTPTASSAEIAYANGTMQVNLTYNLADIALPGSGESDLAESFQLINVSGAPLHINLFHYGDFNITEAPATDSVNLINWSDPWFDAIDTRATQGSGTETHQAFDSSLVPLGALLSTGVEAGAGGPAGVLANLTGVAGYNLNGIANAGPGDVAYAFQYELELGVGESVTIGTDKQMSIIPEPATAALGVLGLVSLLWLRRKS